MFLTDAKKTFLIVMFLYAVSIICRLPNLDRPLSKHHEFNPAAVLVIVEAWQQRAGGLQYGFVPIINYNNPGDYVSGKDFSKDGKGNGIYLSYGPGMYVIPYLVYQALHLPVKPIYLQCINLVFLLIAVVILFQLLLFLFHQKKQRFILTVIGCFLFLFNPCILWFLGNGYVNVTISLPFLLGAIYQSLIIFYKRKKSYTVNYFLLAAFIIIGVYIDWNAFFAAIVISGFSINKSFRQKRIPMVAVVSSVSAVSGIGFIVWQYSHYLTLPQITGYWKARFFSRSIEDTGMNFLHKIMLLFNNLVSGYLPVLLLSVFLFLQLKKYRLSAADYPAKGYFLLSGLACVLYNLTFFNWTFIHDFSLVPIGIFITFIPVYLLSIKYVDRKFRWIAGSYFVLTIVQYYYINRPGKLSQNGTPYAIYQTLGEKIKLLAKPDEMIFMSSPGPVIDFYSKRFVFKAINKQDAKMKLQEWKFAKGIWIEQNDFKFVSAEKITPYNY